MRLRRLPLRVASGAYILHAGLDKWHGDDATAQGVHAMAVSAYPALKRVPPAQFLRLLGAGEIATGAALLAPVVSPAVAGAALTAFSGALMGLYARAPGLRKQGSVWPDRPGTAVSKDVWLLGIGLGLLADAWSSRRAGR